MISTFLIYFFIFLFGLIIGSFLNCLIYRLEKSESFLKGRSYCPHCQHILNWQDLIPVFSFLILKGRCRYCGGKISLQYPLVELATALLFVLIINNQLSINFTIYDLLITIYLLLTTSFLIVIFVYDLKHYLIPDKVIYPAIVTAFIYNLLNTQYLILNTFPSSLGAAAFFLFIVLISHEKWMGTGDVKLAFFMGLILGFPNILVALFLAFFIGATAGLILIGLGKKTLKSEIPFGPFLVTGTYLALFFGQQILEWYLNLFLLK